MLKLRNVNDINWLNFDKLKNKIKNDYYTEDHLNYCIKKGNLSLSDTEYVEYLVSESINDNYQSELVASGNEPIDIIVKNNNDFSIGIDVACVSCNPNKKLTNEKSLAQNFVISVNLDQLWKEGKYDKIINIFRNCYIQKIKKIKEKKKYQKYFILYL